MAKIIQFTDLQERRLAALFQPNPEYLLRLAEYREGVRGSLMFHPDINPWINIRESMDVAEKLKAVKLLSEALPHYLNSVTGVCYIVTLLEDWTLDKPHKLEFTGELYQQGNPQKATVVPFRKTQRAQAN